jgi:sporulation protein YlmC with PRC-barrel domain
MSYVRREDVMGKKAITPDGNSFGDVKDIAFNMDGSVGLVIATKSGTEVIVPLKQAAAIGEFVLLASAASAKAPQPSQPPQPKPAPPAPATGVCPACGSPTKPGAKFCGKCGHNLV